MVEKEKINYCCRWCGFRFDKMVGTFNRVSDQIRCPYCNNFIKTWE